MKKLLALILALVMVFTFAACGSSTSDEEIRGNITGQNSQTDTDSETNNSETNDSSEVKFSIGNASGNKYESNFIGIGCLLDSGWTFYTDAQIAELNNITAETLGDDYISQVEKANLVYDMYATNASGDTINVTLEKLSGLTGVINAETYVDTCIPQLKTSMSQMGVTLEKCEKTQFAFAGKIVDGISIVMSANGNYAYQKIACLKRGSYIAVIGFSTYTTDSTDALISKFYSLDK